MVGVVFHHQPFHRDVSSGTEHAAFQWMELLLSFGVGRVAVINTTGLPYYQASSDLVVEEFASLEAFVFAHPNDELVYVSPHADAHYREFNYVSADWLVIGGVERLDYHHVAIPTEGDRELYPREAAAIVLSEVVWQSR